MSPDSLSGTRLLTHRLRRGWSQARAGELAGIARQSYAAIESGRSIPSTVVALRLARAFGVGVEELFRLADEPTPHVDVEIWGEAAPGRRMRLARVGGRETAFPLEAGGNHAQLLADGVVEAAGDGRARLRPLTDPADEPARRPDLVAAGCDPSFGIAAELLRREHDLDVLWIPSGSRRALEALAAGRVHVAGVHLPDPESGTYNEPWIRRIVPFPATRIAFAVWEQHLVLAAGNPLGVEGVADLARPGVRFLNREPGSGSRALIERHLAEAGVPPAAVAGFSETAADGHLTVAAAVAAGAADAGVAIRAAAQARNLALVPLGSEPYELVVPDHFLDLPAVDALLALLKRPALRRQVEALGGYDASTMGWPA